MFFSLRSSFVAAGLAAVCLTPNLVYADFVTTQTMPADRVFGSGPQRVGLAVQWNDGGTPTTELFGYRFDGSASVTAEAVLAALAGDGETGLHLRWTTPGAFGRTLIGLGFDADADGFSLNDPEGEVGFINGIAETGSSENAVAVDADDRYAEGFFNAGFWSLWGGADFAPWSFAEAGISGIDLADGQWLGLSFATDFGSSAPPAVALPEPTTAVCLVGLALAGSLRPRRR